MWSRAISEDDVPEYREDVFGGVESEMIGIGVDRVEVGLDDKASLFEGEFVMVGGEMANESVDLVEGEGEDLDFGHRSSYVRSSD